MSYCGDNHTGIEELAQRMSDGVEVSLLWNRVSDSLSVVVRDLRSDETFEFAVARSRGLEAFKHPYAYAAFRGVDYAEPIHA